MGLPVETPVSFLRVCEESKRLRRIERVKNLVGGASRVKDPSGETLGPMSYRYRCRCWHRWTTD